MASKRDTPTDPQYLGRQVTGPVEHLDPIPAPAGCDRVVMTSDEVTALCPITGQPDWYTVSIDYVPAKRCIESKSLKLYLWHFRDRGVFCEQLAVDVRDEVLRSIRPREVHVKVLQKSRGGIVIEANASKVRGKG